MQASCDIAFQYAHTREAFGQKIGTFQVNDALHLNPLVLIILTVVVTIISHESTVLPLYNANNGVHSVDRVIAKPPYNEGAFNINVLVIGIVLQWDPRGYHIISESTL